jgi:hypothetical protein
MDRDMIILITLLSIPVAVVIAMEIKYNLHIRKVDKDIVRAVKLKEVESLIQHVKTMTAPKAIVEPPSLYTAVPQAKRRGRPSKAVAV